MNGTIREKREIVGSIFPENLTFNDDYYRTTRINEAARQIHLIESELQESKNGISNVNFDLCRKAEREGKEPYGFPRLFSICWARRDRSVHRIFHRMIWVNLDE